MSKGRSASKLVPFDAARYLTDDAAVAEYVTAVHAAPLKSRGSLMRESLRRARNAGE